MHQPPQFSVLIAAHDAAPFIGDTLRSVACQSLPPTEVIVVDDASRDDTGDIARRHGATVIRNERALGPGAARNKAFAVARSPFVAFLDADDMWDAGHAASCLAFFSDPRVGAVFSATRMFGRVDLDLAVNIPAGHRFDAKAVLLSRNIIPQSGVIVRATEFEKAGGYSADFLLSEDYDLWLRLASRTEFVYTGRTTCLRRIHDRQLSMERRRELVVSAWQARMAAVASWRSSPIWSAELFTSQLVQAARDDLAAVLWTGSLGELGSFLRVLDTIRVDDSRDVRLSDRLGIGRVALPWRRSMLYLRSAGRAIGRTVLSRHA